MAVTNTIQSEISDPREEDAFPDSPIQLRLAAGIVEKLIERNGGIDVTNLFWDEDAFDSLEAGDEYVDPELWNPDEETLPEMKEIEWNLYECN